MNTSDTYKILKAFENININKDTLSDIYNDHLSKWINYKDYETFINTSVNGHKLLESIREKREMLVLSEKGKQFINEIETQTRVNQEEQIKKSELSQLQEKVMRLQSENLSLNNEKLSYERKQRTFDKRIKRLQIAIAVLSVSIALLGFLFSRFIK